MYKGSFVALLTPFKNGQVDEAAFQSFVEWQIQQGTNGLVPCGTTGESPTLSVKEHMRVIELCIEAAHGRLPVMAGTGANATAEAIELSQMAEKAGADSLLHVTPYYNKPSQEGLYQHYKAINDAVGIPIFIYNVPGRSVVNMSLDTMKRLAELPNIRGVKDATGDLERPIEVARAIGPDFCQLTGEDSTAIPFRAAGGSGCISVTGNILPALCAEQHAAWDAGDIARAQDIQKTLFPVHKAMFCETNPCPAKYASKLMGLSSGELRLPLVEISDASKAQVEAALKGVGLLR